MHSAIDVPSSFKIDYGSDPDPTKVLESLGSLISAFRRFDGALLATLDHKSELAYSLKTFEVGSLRACIKYLIKIPADESLKTITWLPVIGDYLIWARKVMINEWNNAEERGWDGIIERIRLGTFLFFSDSHLNYIGSIAYLQPIAITATLTALTYSGQQARSDDKLVVETNGEADELKKSVYIARSPSSDSDPKPYTDYAELVIRKPDLLGDSQWTVIYKGSNARAKILDVKFLQSFLTGSVVIKPGSAILGKVTIQESQSGQPTLTVWSVDKVITPGDGQQTLW